MKATWREALTDFFGPLTGRSPQFGPQVGERFKVKLCEPPVYSLKRLSPGDVVVISDFETGAYTVHRISDGVEEIVAHQNIGERVA